MSVRARHTPLHRLVAALALVILTCASTAIAWALPCAGDCPAMSGGGKKSKALQDYELTLKEGRKSY